MKSQIEMAYNELIRRFISWACSREDIRTVFIVGSRARVDHPADEWSDLDLVIVTRDPEYILSSSEWLKEIGESWISFIEGTAVGEGNERRVLFEHGLDVDFAVIPDQRFRKLASSPEVGDIFQRGIHVLLDKDNLTVDSPSSSGKAPDIPSSFPPSERDFVNLINDFWYHAVWTAKKLLRGELWTAVFCLNCYMHSKVLRVLECHARAVNGAGYDTWHRGRFLEEWADRRALEGLRSSFAYYDEDDAWRALISIMDLFRWLAVETAGRLGFHYPVFEDERATEWVRSHLFP